MNIKDIKPGWLLLVSGHSFVAETIQEFQKLEGEEGWKFNHAASVRNIGRFPFVSEANEHGIVLSDLYNYIRKDNVLLVRELKVPLTEDEVVTLEKLDAKYLGKSHYGFFNLAVLQPIRIISGYLGKELWLGGKKYRKHQGFICGQWVAFSMNELRGCFKDWKKAAPIDLYNDESVYGKSYVINKKGELLPWTRR